MDVAIRFGSALERERISYSLIGGIAAFLHVDQADPIAARITPSVEVLLPRHLFSAARNAMRRNNFFYHREPELRRFRLGQGEKRRSDVHLNLAGELARPDQSEVLPWSPPERIRDVFVAPVADVVFIELVRFRLVNQLHIQDLDGVGLITPEIEAQLSEPLRQRLAQVRSSR